MKLYIRQFCIVLFMVLGGLCIFGLALLGLLCAMLFNQSHFMLSGIAAAAWLINFAALVALNRILV